ncbi:uncharacterized protein [Dermacentor albipictus]|uniref:uncharacterized protein n=1 Tax=Dermacentor albipictus TaxID=60249 RepID=UPI0031FD463B
MSDASSAPLAAGAAIARQSSAVRKQLRRVRVRCTKDEDSDCQLLMHLRRTSRVLLGAYLELVRDDRHPGGIRLAVVRAPSSSCSLLGTSDDPRKKAALRCAEYLLTEHRCITAVEINGSTAQPPALLAALRSSPSVRSVTVCMVLERIPQTNAAVLEAVDALSHLEELAFASVGCGLQAVFRNITQLRGPLLERRTHHLRNLDVSVLMLSAERVNRLLCALTWNHTIAELAVGPCVFTAGFGQLFARYLTKKDATLKKLTLRSLDLYEDQGTVLPTLAEAFCNMTTLEELNADLYMDIAGFFAGRIAPFMKVVALNSTLRCLRLPSSVCERCSTMLSRVRDPVGVPDPRVAQYVEPWHTALRKNSSLRELRIDFASFDEAECSAFLGAVADSDTLRSVIVSHLPARTNPENICRMIRERGLRDRVVVADYHVGLADAGAFGRCAEITGVTVDSAHFKLPERPHLLQDRALSEVFDLAGHVTTLRVCCDFFNETAFAALCAYLSAPSALEDVEITLVRNTLEMTLEQVQSLPRRLASALASNTNLCRVIVRGVQLCNHDMDVLADVARTSRRLVEFRVTWQCNSCCLFDRIFGVRNPVRGPLYSPNAYAYNVLADIQVVTRRNAEHISAAARFVLGERESVEGARSLELVHDHPHLLVLVREGAAVRGDDAKAMVKHALAQLRNYSLHQFMRLAGVVAHGVECPPQDDGRLQLADIGDDCWFVIRSYLRLADIAMTEGRPNLPPSTSSADETAAPATGCDDSPMNGDMPA